MWEKIRVIFTIPELRQKILLTLLLLAIYRVGWQIPLPIVDTTQMTSFFSKRDSGGLGDLFNQVSMFSASQLSQATIFGLGIMPYISASIIFQLLGSVYPPLEKLQKEGESGRKKINEYTRYATVVLCIGQSWFYVGWLMTGRLALPGLPRRCLLAVYRRDDHDRRHRLSDVAGRADRRIRHRQRHQLVDHGGHSRPNAPGGLAGPRQADSADRLGVGRPRGGQVGVETLLVLAVLFVGVVFGVVLITQGQRRIPTQSAKHVRGRRVYGGNRQYLPLRVNQAGVMPIIFASSLLLFPQVLFSVFEQVASQYADACRHLPPRRLLDLQRPVRPLDLLLLLFLDRHFLQSQGHVGQPEKLRHVHSRLPAGPADGRLSGKSHGADHLRRRRLSRRRGHSADVGLVLGGRKYGLASFYGGTSLLIAVSVAFDVVQKIDSHLVMRNYRGLLERG